jgi:hypothetical protein
MTQPHWPYLSIGRCGYFESQLVPILLGVVRLRALTGLEDKTMTREFLTFEASQKMNATVITVAIPPEMTEKGA